MQKILRFCGFDDIWVAQIIRFMRYVSVGGVNFVVCSGTMGLFAYLGLPLVAYSSIGYVVAMTLSFFLNLSLTFKVGGNILQRIVFFFSINLTNLGIVQIIQWLLIDYLHAPVLVAIFSGMVWYTLVGYLLNQRFVFNVRSEATNEAIYS